MVELVEGPVSRVQQFGWRADVIDMLKEQENESPEQAEKAFPPSMEFAKDGEPTVADSGAQSQRVQANPPVEAPRDIQELNRCAPTLDHHVVFHSSVLQTLLLRTLFQPCMSVLLRSLAEKASGRIMRTRPSAFRFRSSPNYLLTFAREELFTVAEKAEYDGYYRASEDPAPSLQWDVPIAKDNELTLRRFLYSLLDQHLNNDLRTNHIDWLLELLRGIIGKDAALPKNRQEYLRLIGKLEHNTRFFLTCASHCCPCNRKLQRCPSCDEPLRINGKPAGIFYVRDPRLWVTRLRSVPALAAALRYPLERQKRRSVGDALEDVWDGALFRWLTKPNAEPLFKPRPTSQPLPVRFCTAKIFFLNLPFARRSLSCVAVAVEGLKTAAGTVTQKNF
jgi:hypothetical protein